MRKLKLDVGELRVESFESDRGMGSVGTVRGNVPFEMPATDDTGGGGGGGWSGVATCPCTNKYSCPDGCSAICTAVTACATAWGGCCPG
jgi:hypothetical protein